MKTNVFKPRKVSQITTVDHNNYLDTIDQSTLNQSGSMQFTAGNFKNPNGIASPNIMIGISEGGIQVSHEFRNTNMSFNVPQPSTKGITSPNDETIVEMLGGAY